MINIVHSDNYDKGTTTIILEESGIKFILDLEWPWPDLVRYHGFGFIKGVVTSPQFPEGRWNVEVNLETMDDVIIAFKNMLSLAQGENNATNDQVRD